MSKNTLLSELINYVSANSSGNVTVAAPASGVALTVSGAGNFIGPLNGMDATFTGQVIATSTSFPQPSLILKGNFDFGTIQFGNSANYNITAGADLVGMEFKVGGSQKMLIVDNGNVGINQSNPTFKLDVNGTGRFTGALSGTSASFTTGLIVSNTADVYPEFKTSAIDADAFLGFSNTGDGNAAWSIGRRNTGEFWISTYTGNFNSGTRTEPLKIATSGAATFSSSVGINGATIDSPLTVQGLNSSSANNTTTGSSANLYAIYARQKGASAGISGTNFMAQLISASGAEGLEIYTPNAKPLVFGTNVTERMRITSSGNVGIGTTTPSEKLSIIGGDVSISSTKRFYLDAGFGFLYLTSTGNNGAMQFYAGDIERMRITAAGNVGIGTTAPSSILDVNTGIQTSSGTAIVISQNTNGAVKGGASFGLSIQNGGESTNAADLWFRTASGGTLSERMRITSGGNLLVGTTTDYGSRVVSYGVDSTSSNFCYRAINSNGQGIFSVRNDGLIFAPGIYNNTNSNLPNVWVNSDGSMYRSTSSSQRFKENINDWSGSGLNTILALKPKTFKYKKNYYNLADVDFLGLIAEEVANVSPYLAEFENQDRTGLVENVRYANIVVPLIKAVQEQQAQIQDLKEQLANK